MDPETEGGSPGLMQQKWFGVPAPVIVVLGALVVYFLFFRNSQSGSGTGASSSAGSGDTQTVGNTTIDKGAVTVTVNTGNGDSDQPQPKPPGNTKTVTVPNVVGKTLPQAQTAIKKRGLNPHADKPFEGRVVRQEKPRSGAKVKKGSTVDLIGQK